ncbi:MAG TPA: hypothetical protein VFB32_14445 [Rudaea sp.]|nr:hypothetical protein [Rudaea sp.]
MLPKSVAIAVSLLLVRAAAAAAPDACVAGEFVIGCQADATLEQLAAYRTQPDAAKTAIVAAVNAGECRLFKNGESVYLVEKAALFSRARVRALDDTRDFWMPLSWVRNAGECATRTAQTAPAPVPRAARANDSVAESAPASPPPARTETTARPDRPCVIKPVMSDEDIAACRR